MLKAVVYAEILDGFLMLNLGAAVVSANRQV